MSGLRSCITPIVRPTSPRALRLRTWLVAHVLGESLGMGVMGLLSALGALIVAGDPQGGEQVALAVVMILAGAVEGAFLGAAQWLVLRRSVPALSAAPWIGRTAAGMSIGWAVGMSASAFEPAEPPGTATILGYAATLGALLGVAVGVAQWSVWRRHVENSASWIGVNAVAWSAGMLISVVGTEAVPIADFYVIAPIVNFLSGAGTGFVVGAILWRHARRLALTPD